MAALAQSLAGVRVVELARVLAGPWAGQTLADLGAEVIKVERPLLGDDTRAWGPPYARDAAGHEIADLPAYFLSTNRGKRSLAIDFARPEGAELTRRLIDTADVVIENFKVGGLERYGLDYRTLAARNPKLVYSSITGFGQDGPEASRAGYDFMIQAMAGLMSVTGQPDGSPGAEPMKVGVALTDVLTGLYATIGILAALPVARVTGQGAHLDVALFDVQVAAMANQALNFFVGQIAGTARQCASEHRAVPGLRRRRRTYRHRRRQRWPVRQTVRGGRRAGSRPRSALRHQPGAGRPSRRAGSRPRRSDRRDARCATGLPASRPSGFPPGRSIRLPRPSPNRRPRHAIFLFPCRCRRRPTAPAVGRFLAWPHRCARRGKFPGPWPPRHAWVKTLKRFCKAWVSITRRSPACAPAASSNAHKSGGNNRSPRGMIALDSRIA